MPALQLIALETTTPQLRAPASGDTYSAPRALDITPETLTGSSATSSLSIAQTWNTTGTPTAFSVAVTDTASNAASLLADFRVGGSSRLSVRKDGWLVTQFGIGAANYYTTGGGLAASITTVGGISNCWSVANGLALNSNATLVGEAANTLALRNGVNAQAFNIYNTYTDASNYERGFVRWASNRLQVGAEALGTGTQRDLDIQGTTVTVRIGTTNGWYFYATNHFGPAGNATQDFGTSALRLRDFYQGGFHDMAEMTAPAAPATNNVRIYAEDNGSGKTRLMALFATGAAQQLAIEP